MSISYFSNDSVETAISKLTNKFLQNFAGGATVSGGSAADVITAGTGNDSLAGGAGSDAYIMSTFLNGSDTVSDSAGSADALSATINGLAAASTGALKISGVETINLSTSLAPSFINAAGITGASSINVGNSGLDAQSVTFNNLAAGTGLGLGFAANTALGAAVNTAYGGTLTFSLADFSGSSDAVTVALNNITTANNIGATLVAAAGIERITIAGSTSTTSGATLEAAKTSI
jgi:hypothetical protein